jgi:hypothetical protein
MGEHHFFLIDLPVYKYNMYADFFKVEKNRSLTLCYI